MSAGGRDDLDDLSMANLSILTASMAIDDSSDDGSDGAYASDDPHIDKRSDLAPPLSPILDGSISPSHVKQTSPPVSPRPKLLVDSDLEHFYELAASLVPLDIITSKAKFAVILAPDGYKHVFSRQWVSKRSMSTVVERPERLKASCIGIGLAQTQVPLKLIRSRTRKSLYSSHLEKVHGKDWATELYALCSKAASNLARGELEVPDSWPYYDIYLAPATAEALEGNIGAIETGLDEIFTGEVRRAFVSVRPPGHHCHESEASGFCIINNAHIAIQYAKAAHGITHAVILDFDLHHGDGSQDLLWKLGFKSDGTAETPMGYFSIHDINSFPCEAGFAEPQRIADASVCFTAHNCAIWNVHLKSYESEEEFDSLYNSDYSVLFRKAAEFLDSCRSKARFAQKPFKPLIVVSAGFDGSEFETPGMQRHKVHVPTSFYNRFTRDTVALAENFGEGYILSLLEGGYSSTAVATGVFSHLTGLAECEFKTAEWCTSSTLPHEIDLAMRQRWRAHPEHWSSRGIQLARALYPTFESLSKGTNSSSAPTAYVSPKERRARRVRSAQ